MQNPFTAEVLIEQSSFDKEIKKIKDNSLITLMSEALINNPISHHNFFKFTKSIKHSFFINDNFDNELRIICEKPISSYGSSTFNGDLIIKKLDIVLYIKDMQLKTNLFMNFANELFELNGNLKNQASILSGWKKINPQHLEKIHHLIPDIIAPQKKIQISEVNYFVIKLDSYHVALDYGVTNYVVEIFFNNFINFLNKTSPNLINHSKISDDKRNTDIYLLEKDKADLFVDFLQHCLNSRNFNLKTKNLDVVLNKMKIEKSIPEKDIHNAKIKFTKI